MKKNEAKQVATFRIGEVYHAELTYKERGSFDERVYAHQGWLCKDVATVSKPNGIVHKALFEVRKNQLCAEPDFPVGKRMWLTVATESFGVWNFQIASRPATANRHGFNVYADKTYDVYIKDDEERAEAERNLEEKRRAEPKSVHEGVYDALVKAVASEYAKDIADDIDEAVAAELEASADKNWNDDDLRLAVGRVLCDRLNIAV